MSSEEVRRIRAKTKLSRANFAPVRLRREDGAALGEWDKEPHAQNTVLLTLIDRLPEQCNRVAAELLRSRTLP